MENKKLNEDQLNEVTGGIELDENRLNDVTGGVKKPGEVEQR